jgi:hypothetical protein
MVHVNPQNAGEQIAQILAGFVGVGPPVPSPVETYRKPSGPKARQPPLWPLDFQEMIGCSESSRQRGEGSCVTEKREIMLVRGIAGP